MKAAAMRYAELLENGCFITHHEQDEIAKLLRGLVMTEDEEWDELERKQNKNMQPPTVDWEAVAADQAMTIAMLRQEVLDEREACAKLLETFGRLITTQDAAAAIRARGEK